jgi:hypothetical protein
VVAGDGSGGVPMLGEVAFVGAAAATLAGSGVAAAASLVRAAADVALSELPAKAPEKVVMQAEGSGSQSGRVGGAKAKEKEKGENNGKSFSIRQSARPTANPWFRAVLYMQFYNRNFIT